MPGRPMKEYVTLPNWQARPTRSGRGARDALDYALTLPPKKK